MSFHIKRAAICLWMVILLLLSGRVVASAQNIEPNKSSADNSSTNQIFVHLKGETKASSMLSVASSLPDAEYAGGIPNTRTLIYKVDGDVEKAVEDVKKNGNVADASVVPYWYALDITLDDAYKDQLWALDSMNVRGSGDKAWNLFVDKTQLNDKTSAIKVAVFDSGVNGNHPDLAGKVVNSIICKGSEASGTYVVTCSQGGIDDGGHGTHVAGIIGAIPNNQGIAGIGWGTKIIAVKVLHEGGRGTLAEIMYGLNWVADHAQSDNIKIVNLSLGGSIYDSTIKQELQNVMDSLWSKGVVVVAAAGNSGDTGNPVFYPAAFRNVLSVASVDRNNNLAPYSEYNDPVKTDPPYVTDGHWIDVAAPGGSCSVSTKQDCILSTWNDSSKPCTEGVPDNTGSYCYMNGTSQASPYVAGLVALVWARNPSLSNADVVSIIQTTANHEAPKVGGNNATVFGAVNAFAAVNSALSAPTVTPGASTTPRPSSTVSPSPTGIRPTVTPSRTPSSTLPAYPTTGPARLPKVVPNPYPQGPYCPVNTGCTDKSKGDGNCNGVVDQADYDIWLIQFDTMVSGDRQNPNANYACVEGNSSTYFIDLTDFEVWRRYTTSFGLTSPTPTSGGQPTLSPSPTTTLPTASPTACPPMITGYETRPSAIYTYCTQAEGLTCNSPNVFRNPLHCYNASTGWYPYGPSCTNPYCDDCLCLSPTPGIPTATPIPPTATPTSRPPEDCWRCPGPNCDKCGVSRGDWHWCVGYPKCVDLGGCSNFPCN